MNLQSFATITLLGVFACTGPSFSQSSCGSCNFPENKLQSAAALEQEIIKADHNHLRRLLFVGEVCAERGLTCGNLSEDEAGRLVQYHFDTSSAQWDAFHKIALGIVAFAGLGLG
ncbi:MAG: hypothetical protein AAGJ35_07005, partial [Myxococcota bacterium]